MKTSESESRILKYVNFFYLCFILNTLNTILFNSSIYESMLKFSLVPQRRYPFLQPPTCNKNAIVRALNRL